MTNSLLSGLDFILKLISHKPQSRFFILGKTRTTLPSFLEDNARKQGCKFMTWSYGEDGSIFLLTSHTDIAESEEMLVLKLGYARSQSYMPLHAQQLLEQRVVTPQRVNYEAIHGNALVMCVSQHKPSFCLYQSLCSIEQIYYWKESDTILFSDSQRYLTTLIHPLEINLNAIPLHLLYRTVPGEMTYFSNIFKFLGGQAAFFDAGMWRIDQLERLDDLKPKLQIQSVLSETISEFDHLSEKLVGSYVAQIDNPSNRIAILLSGGVDSSLIASWVKSNLSNKDQLKSLSYNIHVPSFKEEINYAHHAIEILESQHQFFDIFPEDYPSLLEQSIDVIAQPIDNEQDPCYLALARYVSSGSVQFLFSGSDPDCLLGRGDVKRLQHVNRFQNIPGANLSLALLGRLLNRFFPNKAYGMREVSRLLKHIKDPVSLYHPVNLRGMMTDLGTVQKCFPPEVIRKTMEYKLNEFNKLTDSTNLVERVHFNSYSHDVRDEEASIVQLFRVYDLELVDPYLDSDFLRLSMGLSPEIRYYAMGQTKWILKQILGNRTGSKSVNWPKRSGGFDNELFQWMKSGVLRDHVNSIERPEYLSIADFNNKIDQPDWLTWNLLTLDLFQKRVLNGERNSL